jgi:phospholipid/cholesterol/gamma-HCH transport system substrate-binding protein
MKTMNLKFGREVKIGLFALVMMVSLYLGVNYLKGKEVFNSDRIYYALFDHTNGLQTSASVLLRGVKVGSVTGISLSGDHPDKVVVTLGVKKSIDIPSDSHLALFSRGMMGEVAIELVRGTSASYFEHGTVIPTEIRSDLFESISTNIDDLVAEAGTVMNSLAATSESLNNLLTQNTDAIKGILENLKGVSGQLSEAGIEGMIADLGAFTAVLRENSQRLGGIIGNLDEVTGSLADADLGATVNSLDGSITRLETVLAKLSEGEGTAARLLNNPALYDSLTVATGNLSALLEDLKANPKRYVHFSLFGGQRK